jgi:hypothetical protein
MPKLLIKIFTALKDVPSGKTIDFGPFKTKFAEDVSMLAQYQVAALIKTIEYHGIVGQDERDSSLAEDLIGVCLSNARLPNVAAAAWLENVSTSLLNCLSASRSPSLLASVSEWVAFVANYEDALNSGGGPSLEESTPAFARLRRAIEERGSMAAAAAMTRLNEVMSCVEDFRLSGLQRFIAVARPSKIFSPVVEQAEEFLSSGLKGDKWELEVAKQFWIALGNAGTEPDALQHTISSSNSSDSVVRSVLSRPGIFP